MMSPRLITKNKSDNEPLLAIDVLSACRILIINGKGGSGKTTVSTNLAAWLAQRGDTTVLVDADPQCSASDWLSLRAPELPKIFGVKIENNRRLTRSFQSRAPKSTRWIITDAPSGLCDMALDDLIQQQDIIVLPIPPSDIDVRASTRFINELLQNKNIRRKPRPIAVVGNRMNHSTIAWERLQGLLDSVNIPCLASFRDCAEYVNAYSSGQGLADRSHTTHENDFPQWNLLLNWLDNHETSHQWIHPTAISNPKISINMP